MIRKTRKILQNKSYSIPFQLTLASKKVLAPLTPSVETSISERRARAQRPLSSASSPAAAFLKISRNCGRQEQQTDTDRTGTSILTFNLIKKKKLKKKTTLLLHLSEAELVVEVFIHLFDHILQADVRLRSSKLLHHQLQLHQVNVVVLTSIIP